MAYRDPTSFTENSCEPSGLRTFDLDATLDHVAHWLPTQAPIKDFIHHNTLHAVQHLPFHEGVAKAAKIFGACSYLPIEDYQRMYGRGRIKDFAIEWAISHSGCAEPTRKKLRARLFQPDDSSHYPPVSLANHGIRNAWVAQLELDLNLMVHPVLFRLLGNFLDQGISRWRCLDGRCLKRANDFGIACCGWSTTVCYRFTLSTTPAHANYCPGNRIL